MQLFPCPFCGPRSESEFHFIGDDRNTRPDGVSASADAWSSYLNFRNNTKGQAMEVWMHLICGELFRMDRDTVSHAVASSAALLGAAHS
jgi:sarcosine oxidase subunit delta